MTFSSIKKHPFFKFITNKYVLILVIFITWMFFFDEKSYLTHQKFDKEIDDLKTTIEFYKSKIKKDKETIKKLQDSLELERFAREKYYMKKDKEDVYIIEFDTIKK